jgi:NADH-quinone oxidoreductase subunit L
MTTATIASTHAATGVFSFAWLLIALPLAGAAILLLGGRRTNPWGHLVGTAASIGSFVVALTLFVSMIGKDAEHRSYTDHLYTFIKTSGFDLQANLLVDQLSISFVLLITFVGSLIHIYSIGYMEHDPARRKFFGYLNLFVASMLLLVLADSYLLVYVGWEGVGLASYLLIGFWLHKPTAATAAKKAFVINRVGDMGLALAVMTMFATFGTVSFEGVFAAAPNASAWTLTAIGLFLLVAACGKSAQFPLQAWLLDAMEGPTPVSALIHAATMVTAGVYLIVRSGPIFDLSPDARNAVIVVGAITLLFGAVIGTAKDDIKKALAASTMSQIGYMILAAGLGPAGYVFAIFHLLTHGFFKAGMFLGAGSVMHGMKDQVNMRRYGALRAFMVITFGTFFCGYLAIIGVPPFAGFFSKDKIIEAAFAHSNLVGIVTLVGAGITAFYMTRLVIMTFFGKARWDEDQHPHESPAIMTIPMILLAVGSVLGGYIGFQNERIIKWLEPAVGFHEAHPALSIPVLTAMTITTVVAGVLVAVAMYRREVPVTAPAGTVATRAARADLYGDAFNESVFMRPGQWLTRFLVYFDNRVIDGAVNGTAAFLGGLSSRGRRTQTGYARSYALSIFIGAALVAGALLLVRL